MLLKNKKILLTGSSGFLGKALEKSFLKSGAKFYGLDLKKKTKNTFVCNITDELQVKNFFKKNINSKLDVLINNASVNPGLISELKKKSFKFSNYELETWKRGIEVDLVGSFLLSKYALKIFEKKNAGTIINISSIYGLIGPDQKIYGNKKKFTGFKPIEYSVAKAGLIGFTKALASFYSNTNIKIIALVFGGINNKFSNGFIEKYSNKTVQGRMANINEIINYVNFFVSNKSSYSSGNCIVIDGGATSIL